jgi:hypothetical protein
MTWHSGRINFALRIVIVKSVKVLCSKMAKTRLEITKGGASNFHPQTTPSIFLNRSIPRVTRHLKGSLI